MGSDRRAGILKALGPGLLFAAAAVGVSHLVQSTRAGAQHGVALIAFVLLANVSKYPAFRFAPEYAAATGTSLLEGYRKQGKWALGLYSLVTFATMFTVQAAVAVVTAGLAITTFGLGTSAVWISAGLIALCLGLLAVGQFRWLDRATKVLVAIFTLCTLIAVLMVLPRVPWNGPWMPEFFTPRVEGGNGLDLKTVMFTVALMGWMPAPVDLAVWQSLWTLARKKDTGHAPTVEESRLDFHIGYLGSAILALCFVTMGAGVMYGSGQTFAASAGKFAGQVVGLYTESLGSGLGVVVGIAAFAVMFSTTLTVVDGFPRALSTLAARFASEEKPHQLEEGPVARRNYWIAAGILAVGSVIVLAVFLTSFKAFVDLATTASFLTAPALAYLNHRVITADEVPAKAQPSPGLRTFSALCIVFHTALALCYLYVKYVS